MKKNWFAVKVESVEEATEAIEHAFNVLDSLGTEIDFLGTSKDKPFTVTGFFETDISLDIAKAALKDAFLIYDLPADKILGVSSTQIIEQDWLAEWKKHWKPTETAKFIVAPTWSDIPQTSKHIIRIDPKMAFGTGTHETTRLCLQAIEKYLTPGMSFLDVGTGTGILSIAASMLGASSVTGCDTDRDSVEIAIENLLGNRVTEFSIYEGSISAENQPAELVCANVTADVIVPLLPLLISKSLKILVLSGILVEQTGLISGALANLGKFETQIATEGEWISVAVLH
ncbi:MAG: 50S ribosomal protein L11 methyltransferase [Pyrinomonadaceae bacterium]